MEKGNQPNEGLRGASVRYEVVMVRDSEVWWKEGVGWSTNCGVAIGRGGVGLPEGEELGSK